MVLAFGIRLPRVEEGEEAEVSNFKLLFLFIYAQSSRTVISGREAAAEEDEGGGGGGGDR